MISGSQVSNRTDFQRAQKKVPIPTNLLLNQSVRNPAGKLQTGEVLQRGNPVTAQQDPNKSKRLRITLRFQMKYSY